MTQEQVYSQVTQAISTVLNKKPEQIKGDSKILADLGAESIDFTDIGFELEMSLKQEVDFKEIIGQLRAKENDKRRNDLTVDEVVGFIVAKNSAAAQA